MSYGQKPDKASGHFKIAILRMMAVAFSNGSRLDRFSVKLTPRNNCKIAGPPTLHINFSGLLDYAESPQISLQCIICGQLIENWDGRPMT